MPKYTWTRTENDYVKNIARRDDETFMTVEESVDSTSEYPLWDIYVLSPTGCCEFLVGDLEGTEADMIARAESVILPDEATAADCEGENG